MGFGAGSDGQPVEVAQFLLERPGSKEDVSGASQFVEPARWCSVSVAGSLSSAQRVCLRSWAADTVACAPRPGG